MGCRHLGWALVTVLSVSARLALGGTGLGNEFEHYVNNAFDFHVAMPPVWQCTGCESDRAFEETWSMQAPEGTTWLNADFISDFPASNEAELKVVIEREHPGVDWQVFDRGGFVGFSSSAQGDAANAATEYYLIAKRQVIRLTWVKDAALPSRAVELDNIKRSIDRASAPPAVTAVTTERQTPYAVGEIACVLVEVDDLRASFDAKSLTEIEIQGAPAHWSFKEITWVPEKNWFRACWKVTNAFGPTGLMIKALAVEDMEISRSVSCDADTDEPAVLKCRRYPSESGAPNLETIRQVIAPVLNAAPDTEGPEIFGLVPDVLKGTITVKASDGTGIAAGEIFVNGQRLVAYADNLVAGGTVDMTPALHGGWNTVTQVILYDTNGMPTLLMVPEAPDRRAKSGLSAKPTHQGDRDGDGANYILVPWGGQPRPSGIPVVSFLKERHLTSGGKR